MVSTIERNSVFTRSFSHTGVANRSSELHADDDVFPPSRSGSFISTSSSSSRRIGVVNERQLDSLQKRLINTPAAVPGDSTDNAASKSFQNQQPPFLSGHQLYRLTPLPPRRPMTAEHNRLVLQSSASSSPAWRPTAAGQLAAELEGNTAANTSCRNGPCPNPQIDRKSSQVMPANGCLDNRKYHPVEYGGTLPHKSNHFRPTVDGADRRRSVSVCDFVEISCASRNELESRLIEREAELRSLRETMERNERAILKVLDDQRRRSNVETTARRAEWTRKLDELSTKASKEQRILSENLEQLKIENNQLKAALNITKDRVKVLERCQKEWRNSRSEVVPTHYDTIPVARQLSAPEIVSETTCDDIRRQMSFHSVAYDAKPNSLPSTDGQSIYSLLGECFSGSLRKSVNSNNKLHNTGDRPLSVNGESDVHATGLDLNQSCQDSEADEFTSYVAGNGISQVGNGFPFSAARSVDTIKNCHYCEELQDKLEKQRLAFDDERRRWLEEKEQVIAYQKLLQVGYVQLVKRCEYLENELRQREVFRAGINDSRPNSKTTSDNSSEMKETNVASVTSQLEASACVC